MQPQPTANSTVAEVRRCLSAARMSTYDTAVLIAGPTNDAKALALYEWNARMSGALMALLHLSEVVVRNAVSEALEQLYGPRWPWTAGFIRSLPNPPAGYNPQRDLQKVSKQQPTTGKVIPELKFVFWQKMFTGRHDRRLWNPYIHSVFPHALSAGSPQQLRASLYTDLEQMRLLRNRIAHHEPIFSRNLSDDIRKALELIEFRSADAAQWAKQVERASTELATRPT